MWKPQQSANPAKLRQFNEETSFLFQCYFLCYLLQQALANNTYIYTYIQHVYCVCIYMYIYIHNIYRYIRVCVW